MNNTDKIIKALEAVQSVQATPEIISQTETLNDALNTAYDALIRAYAKADHDGFLDYIHAATEDEINAYLD